MLKGLTFDDVLSHVHQRHGRALPDAVVRLSELRLDEEGRFRAPGSALAWRLNDWARKQLASLLGIRWDRWFDAASPAERADEVNRRLSRMPGERKVRAFRDDSGVADGVLRAFLSPSFTPIDDVRVFDRLAATQRAQMDAYRFTRLDASDTATQYTAVHQDPVDVDGDVVHPGFHFRNSEVGAGPLTLDDLWHRLACENGLLVRISGKRLLSRVHRRIEDDDLSATLVVALSHLPTRWALGAELLRRAIAAPVLAPDVDVAHALAGWDIPRGLIEEVQKGALAEKRSRYDVVQAITAVAHDSNKDPDIRFRMEQAAGEYLAATEVQPVSLETAHA